MAGQSEMRAAKRAAKKQQLPNKNERVIAEMVARAKAEGWTECQTSALSYLQERFMREGATLNNNEGKAILLVAKELANHLNSSRARPS